MVKTGQGDEKNLWGVCLDACVGNKMKCETSGVWMRVQRSTSVTGV